MQPNSGPAPPSKEQETSDIKPAFLRRVTLTLHGLPLIFQSLEALLATSLPLFSLSLLTWLTKHGLAS